MRLLILTPEQPRSCGNWVSASRFQAGLQALGHGVEVVETGPDPARLEEAVARFRPQLVLLLHAFRSGGPWLASPSCRRLPALVLLTGTDIHQGLERPQERPTIRAVLHQAGAILSQNPLTLVDLAAAQPELAPRLHYLPPGVVLGKDPYELRRRHGIAEEAVLFLHPAGIRAVKGNRELLELFDPVAAADPRCRLAFCGPLLEADYAEGFLAALQNRPWAAYLGEIPQAAMPAALRQADIVCNHSSSEGLPNSLLEAACLGRPMLVRNIQGNRAVVEAGLNGLCYETAEEFTAQALALLRDPDLRRRLSRPQPERYRPQEEARALEAICRQVLEGEHQ
jgi:L-malate glycosyltransferase